MTKMHEQLEEKQQPPEDFYQEKWQKERACFVGVLKDNYIRSDYKGELAKERPVDWNGETSDIVMERSYKQFIEKITDEKTGQYYLARDEQTGLPIKSSKPTYKVTSIIRLRRNDDKNSEFLLSKGIVIAYDQNGDEVKFTIPFREVWSKTTFLFETANHPKKVGLIRECKGVKGVEQVYTLPFTKENAKRLLDQRKNDKVAFTVIEEQTDRPVEVRDVNLPKTFELFLKPFDYVYNADYLSPQQKAEIRARDVSEGWAPAIPTEVTNVSNPPKGATYS